VSELSLSHSEDPGLQSSNDLTGNQPGNAVDNNYLNR